MTEYQKTISKILDELEIQLAKDTSLPFEFNTFANPACTHIGIRGKETILANGITITDYVRFSDKYQQHTVELTIMLDFKTNHSLSVINSIFSKIKDKVKRQLKKEYLL